MPIQQKAYGHLPRAMLKCVLMVKLSFWQAHPRRWASALLASLALGIFLLCAPAALAALQLNYFNVIAFPTSVTLEWSTASEVNLAGFDVQCKLASEPDSAFHEIGYVRAKGGPNVGALYTFNVASGVVPGVSYCFRLKEITTDGSPGEVIDRCGYGPLVTPTPGSGAIPVFTPIAVPTDAFGNPIVPTPTPAVPAPPAVPTDAFGNPIPPTPFIPQAVPTDAFGSPLPTPMIPGAVPTDAFGNPLPTPIIPGAVPTDAFGNPLPTPIIPGAVPTDAFGNPLPPTPTPLIPGAVPTDAFGSPLATPTLPVSAAAVPTDAFGNPLAPMAPASADPAAVATDAFGNPLAPDPFVAATQTAAASATAAATVALTDPQAIAAANAASQEALAAAATNMAAAAAGVPVNVPVVTPTPAFIVVTATPTPAPVALAPVYTPLPSATPAPAGMQLASTLDPSQNLTQNLMVMLLCLTFTGASGIGIVGLITSVMFMRSRSSQREFYERTNTRRRL